MSAQNTIDEIHKAAVFGIKSAIQSARIPVSTSGAIGRKFIFSCNYRGQVLVFMGQITSFSWSKGNGLKMFSSISTMLGHPLEYMTKDAQGNWVAHLGPPWDLVSSELKGHIEFI